MKQLVKKTLVSVLRHLRNCSVFSLTTYMDNFFLSHAKSCFAFIPVLTSFYYIVCPYLKMLNRVGIKLYLLVYRELCTINASNLILYRTNTGLYNKQ